MKILAKYIGGSQSYGLSTPSSDIDERFVYLNTDINDIIGLDKGSENKISQNSEEDSVGYELRRFLQLLRKTNTSVVEILFNEEWQELDQKFQRKILDNRNYFLDTEFFFKSLCGYLQGERRLTNGERTGRLGGKRKEALEKYGYSYKNLVQFIRLCYAGSCFFNSGIFPVNISRADSALAQKLMFIKTMPEKTSLEEVGELMDIWEKHFKYCFNKRNVSKDFKFNSEKANEILLDFYYPVLKEKFESVNSRYDYKFSQSPD